MFLENTNEVNEIFKSYTSNLVNSRPDFLKMVYDSYSEFDYDELETINTANLSEKSLNNLSHKSEKRNLLHKGFYTSFDQFFKGYESDKWTQLMGKVLKNVKLNNNQQSKDKAPLEIKQLEFMKPEDAPKRPEWKFAINLKNLQSNSNILTNSISSNQTQSGLNFNFVTKEKKCISFSIASNIKQEKLQKYIKDIFMDRGGDQIIKLIDHRDNKIIFVEKLDIKNSENGEPFLNGEIELKSLEKRADILVTSRLVFIEKVATTVCKFIISLKKLYKNKKDKEKQRTLHEVNSVRSLNAGQKEGYQNFIGGMSQSASGGNIIKEINEKLKRMREIISSKSIKTILSSSNSNSSNKGQNGIELNRFKKILNKKIENKDKRVKMEKLRLIKEKVKKVIESEEILDEFEDDEKEYDDSQNLQSSLLDDSSVIDVRKSGYDPLKTRNSQVMHSEENNFETPKKKEPTGKKRKIVVQNTQLLDFVKDLADEKVIMPKKKLNCNGLKMFIKEEFSKIKKN